MAGFDDHRWGDVGVQSVLPTCRAYAPFVAWLQSGKSEIRSGCDEIVALGDREIQEFPGHDRANHMGSAILFGRPAKAVAVKSGDRILTARLERGAQDIHAAQGNDFIHTTGLPRQPAAELKFGFEPPKSDHDAAIPGVGNALSASFLDGFRCQKGASFRAFP